MTDDRRIDPDPLDALLARASASPANDERVAVALDAVAAHDGSRTRAPIIAIAAVGAAALVLSGGAVAASVWGPWRVIPDPHFAFERDWYSAAGELEGTCRSHWEFTLVRDEQTRDAALEILSELPIDDIDPDPEVLSKWYEIVGDGGLDEWGWTDLDIRQHALDQTVSNALLNEFERRGLDSSGLLLIRGEYQCSEVGAP